MNALQSTYLVALNPLMTS